MSEWSLFAVAIVGASIPLLMVPLFRGLFAELDGELPWLTVVLIESWWGLVSEGMISGILVLSALPVGPLALRRVLLALAFLMELALIGLTILAGYLPIFALADQVRAY